MTKLRDIKNQFFWYDEFMNKDEIKEKLTLYRTLITIFWTSAFILGSGLFSLLFKLSTFLMQFLFITGIIFELFLLIISVSLMIRCKKLIKKFKEIK